jgi:hypothetical protein
MASVFIALPLGVVGGLVAAWAVQRRSHQLNTSYWVGRGLLSGLTIGAGGCVLYVFALGGLSPDPAALVFYVVVGAASGAACGLIVGLWCAHTAKQLH